MCCSKAKQEENMPTNLPFKNYLSEEEEIEVKGKITCNYIKG